MSGMVVLVRETTKEVYQITNAGNLVSETTVGGFATTVVETTKEED